MDFRGFCQNENIEKHRFEKLFLESLAQKGSRHIIVLADRLSKRPKAIRNQSDQFCVSQINRP